MFVKIQKAGKTVEVTKSAFLNYFSNMGWTEADAKASEKPKKEVKVESNINTKVEEENPVEDGKNDTLADEWEEALSEDDDEVEKPLSEMSKKELTQLASEKGIDTNGMNTNQIREAIKKTM